MSLDPPPTMTTTTTTTPPKTMTRFVLGELALVFAPDAVVLESAGVSGMALLPVATAATAQSSAAVPSSSMSITDVRRFVRTRRLLAVWFSMASVVLPAAPIVNAIVRALRGGADPLIEIVVAIAMFVPLSLVGLLGSARLTPVVFRRLGVVVNETPTPTTPTTPTSAVVPTPTTPTSDVVPPPTSSDPVR